LCLNVLDKLIELRQVPYQGTELEQLGKGEGYCRRQVEGWDARYSKALTPNVPDFAFVRQWLQQHIPADSKTCVIHNDWRFDNVILDPQQPNQSIGVICLEIQKPRVSWWLLFALLDRKNRFATKEFGFFRSVWFVPISCDCATDLLSLLPSAN